MKAFSIDRYGKGPLRLGDMPDPAVGDDDVLVQIHAAGLNLLDSKIKSGEFKLFLPHRMPLVLGHDVAGVVLRVGSRVRRFKAGDAVFARVADHRIGTLADMIAINQADVALKPKSVTMEEAASLPLVGLTAWQALVEVAKVKKGQKVFIQAGSGGVGTFAIQLAKHLGASVATTAGTSNLGLVRSLGADVVVDYKREDFETKLHGYDVVLNSQDAKTLAKSWRVLRHGGHMISISGPPDPEFARQVKGPWFLPSVTRLLSLGARRQATRLGGRYSFLFMRADGAQLGQIAKLVDDGVIRPVVDRVFPFESTNEALVYVESGRAKGKVVVKMR
jgi:NADPH:quinone reductase-like Zn-dependent oxidoreductase